MAAKVHYREGLKLISAGDLHGAFEMFHRSLEVDPDFYLGHLGLAQVLDRQGKVDDAIRHAREAIRIAPEEPLAHTSLSRLYQQKGLIDEAEAEMELSRRLQP